MHGKECHYPEDDRRENLIIKENIRPEPIQTGSERM
jgi:hypothetical protein